MQNLKQEIIKTLKNVCLKFDINLTVNQLDKFADYACFLIEYNKKVNLSSIKKPFEIVIKHFLDSLIVSKIIKIEGKLIDIGSGAGFPGVPLKILNSSLNLTVLDSSRKKINFLTELANLLSLNINIINERAEKIACTNLKESFQICTARAVAPLNMLCKLCLPFVEKNGVFIALKGPLAETEINSSFDIIKILGGEIIETKQINLPENLGKRILIKIKKVKTYSINFN
ncbi:MAG: 16S rRNA (guanine(527)-N(7))-methyltransferase RsmG [Oscillospiraceae bacterium]|nr:16S rRNA (guanine(527)-N(7))-methyltransferase RsmG [Oscillospiraceae bacterium]